MKKKLLFVVNHFGYSNGVAISLRNMIENLDYHKYDISLLALYEYDKKFAEPISGKIRVIRGFWFYFRGFDKLVNLLPMKLLYKYFVSEQYDAEISYQYGVPTRMLSVSSNKRKICWMHTYDTNLNLRKYYEKYAKIVTVSRAGSEKLIKEGFSKSQVEYCYNIIDEQHLLNEANESIYCSVKKTIVITVARLDSDKAYFRYFNCIKAFKDEILKQNIEFWIIGGGSEEDALRKFIENNGLQECIIMFGAQTNPYKYMNIADVYFCASYREGFSTACQEAAMLGIPVVSVNVDGAMELLELTGCGQGIDNDENGIKKGLSIIINNAEKVTKWKTKALKNKELFYKACRTKKIEQVIDEVLTYS